MLGWGVEGQSKSGFVAGRSMFQEGQGTNRGTGQAKVKLPQIPTHHPIPKHALMFY